MELDWLVAQLPSLEKEAIFFYSEESDLRQLGGNGRAGGEVLGGGWKCRRRKTDLRSGEEAGLREEEYRAEGEGARRRGGEERRR